MGMFRPLDFRFYHDRTFPLSAVCPWDVMIDDGIVLIKGGALCCGFEFIAPDIGASSDHKIASVARMLNNAVLQLGDGWTVQFELQRRRTGNYTSVTCENFAAYLVEMQREMNFSAVTSHYENHYFAVLTWMPPPEIEQKASLFFIRKASGSGDGNSDVIQKQLNYFRMTASKVMSVLSAVMYVERLDSDGLFTLIHSSVSLDWHRCVLPEDAKLFIDEVATDSDLENSMPLRLGYNYIPLVTVIGFPSRTFPAMLDTLNKADCELRWSTRFRCRSRQDALKTIKSRERNFHGRRTSTMNYVIKTLTNTSSEVQDTSAVASEGDAQNAVAELTIDAIGYGDYLSTIMVWDEDLSKAEDKSRYISSVVTASDFSVKEETQNSLQAFLAMMPGNIYANVRSLFVSTGNLSHVIPASSIWSGPSVNEFMRSICGIGAPHVVCGTDYGIPFYLNLNVGDTGHTWISGPNGSGKSALLALLEVQWLKYPGARVCIFDKDRSARNVTMCAGGLYLEPGKDGAICFQPLEALDTDADRAWAASFIEMLLAEQHIDVTVSMKEEIFNTIRLLSSMDPSARTLTSFCQYCSYKDPETYENTLTGALAPYVIGGQFGSLFDSAESSLPLGSFWNMIEMGTLMELGSQAVTPALYYIFHKVEAMFDGRPFLLVIDEGWQVLQNPVFASQLAVWLKTLRKKHVFVIFATQEVNDAARSEIGLTILSQCATKIYLADPEAESPMIADSYRKFGLEDSEISLLTRMVKKHDYLYKSALGVRRFQIDIADAMQLGILTGAWNDPMYDSLEQEYGVNSGKPLVREILKAKGIEYEQLLATAGDAEKREVRKWA